MNTHSGLLMCLSLALMTGLSVISPVTKGTCNGHFKNTIVPFHVTEIGEMDYSTPAVKTCHYRIK